MQCFGSGGARVNGPPAGPDRANARVFLRAPIGLCPGLVAPIAHGAGGRHFCRCRRFCCPFGSPDGLAATAMPGWQNGLLHAGSRSALAAQKLQKNHRASAPRPAGCRRGRGCPPRGGRAVGDHPAARSLFLLSTGRRHGCGSGGAPAQRPPSAAHSPPRPPSAHARPQHRHPPRLGPSAAPSPLTPACGPWQVNGLLGQA